MNLRRIQLLATAMLIAVVAAPLAHAKPVPGWLRALEVRGQGMNELCEDPTLAREGYRVVCGTAGAQQQPTRAELRALDIRGRGLNELVSAPVVQANSGSSGFDWGDFGIGAGATLGLVMLAGGIAAGLHYSRRNVRPRTSS
jgi:hypothetical protein